MKHEIVYKICDKSLWANAESQGVFKGAEIDLADGFIHFSTADQTLSTLEKHFVGRKDLLLIAVDAAALGDKIIYEEARGNTLFPHLYEPLQMNHVLWVKPIDLDGNGQHIVPNMEPQK